MREVKADFSFSCMDKNRQSEFWATLALRYCKGLGSRFACKLVKFFGSALAAANNRDNWKEAGVPQKIIAEFTSGNWQKAAEKEWKEAHKKNLNIILWNDAEFPTLLKEIPDPPLLLYFMGSPDLLHSPCVALVGSRNAQPGNLDIARQLAADLSAYGITVVSGMAMGIDAAAHEGALGRPGKSIGVLGTGINIIYPWSNRSLFARMQNSGLLLSEFSPSAPPLANHFPIRNRIISALSLGVVVIEAAEKSGSLITAKLALEQNREVFAIPGPAFNTHSRGCQNLVRAGAHPVFSADDIFSELRPRLLFYNHSPNIHINYAQKNLVTPPETLSDDSAQEPVFSGSEAAKKMTSVSETEKIMDLLKKSSKYHIDDLAEKLEMELDEISPLLLSMELLGKITRLPGGYYAIR